ncbi:hybrid sensor histidine kinase/response regulator [Variovorax paradoxus]|uniref:hybrid sensor histidine kinase/response regulator n=1 Tax=Variovorax paradoxus TaxID=34073 RepID=UPI0027822B54|nr:hybrid sensor histidine kinase/response regulator [Variovorax paradoxus]MDP9933091.1 two-component system sensor histidine kinase and response regulator WspE [Variovorax paradoxus]
MTAKDLSELSMLELFRVEVENQAPLLTAGLLALERDPEAADQLEACMRAAHSLKGAARIVDIAAAVGVAHAMEDCFVAAQDGRLRLRQSHIDLLLGGVDLLARFAQSPEMEPLDSPQVKAFALALESAMQDDGKSDPGPDAAMPASEEALMRSPAATAESTAQDRVVRVSADNLNRLLGLAGESLVAARWLRPFADSLLRLKRLQHETVQRLDALHDHAAVPTASPEERTRIALDEIKRRVAECEQLLAEGLADMETFERRSADLSRRLYDEAVACRMRPFADGVHATPRMLRDLGRSLGKQVRLEIVGAATPVDRDVLERLDAPLGHLLRNAIDHGIESPEQRRVAGKPAEGVVRLEARHSAGALEISVSDDGRGISLDAMRRAVVERNHTKAELAAELSEAELLEFLFLPGFTLSNRVTDMSGRGVGLDAVQDMVKQVRGSVRVSTEAGQGTRFQLQLPLTLSVVRTLLADVGGEPYAFPLARIVRAARVAPGQVELLEGRQHIEVDGRRIGLVTAHQILQAEEPQAAGGDLAVVVIGDHDDTYGVVVDRFLGERELVVHALDPRLGKIKDISAGALMEDGSPVLIIDVEDMIRSVQKLIASGHLSQAQPGHAAVDGRRPKRVLVVDDSLTVRELERKLLAQHGYEVEVAVDGMDGWNAVRTGHFDLLVTDVDMPRMDGIELVALVKKNPNLKSLPVMIMSYKDRAEDHRRGLEAGADHYLTKGSFHDETLLQAVVDLIGEAVA